MITVQEINDFQALEQFSEPWGALLAETPGATFFHTLDWLLAYARHYRQNAAPRVLVMSERGSLVGIVPLVIRSEPRRIGSVRVLTYPLDDWGSFYGPIGSRPAEVLAAAAHYISRTRRSTAGTWDLFDLRWIDATSPAVQYTPAALEQAGFTVYPTLRTTTAVIDLGQTWEEFVARWTSKFRNNYRRHERRLEELGDVEHIHYRPRGVLAGDADPRWDLLEDCLAVAAQSWQGQSQSGTTLSHVSIEPFIRDVHQTAARAGGLDLHLIRVNTKPVAFAYNYHYRGSVFGLRIGFLPELSKVGVGNVMYGYAIRAAFQQRDRVYDMGPGSLDIKRFLATRYVPIWQFTHYRTLAPLAQALRLKQIATRFLPGRDRAESATMASDAPPAPPAHEPKVRTSDGSS